MAEPARSRLRYLIGEMERSTETFKRAVNGSKGNVLDMLRRDTPGYIAKEPAEPAEIEKIEKVREELEKVKKELAQIKREAEEKEIRQVKEMEQVNRRVQRYLAEILQLKGNIRVICRIKPLLLGEKVGSNIEVGERRVVLKNSHYSFGFSSVLFPSSTQEDLFNEVEDLVLSSVQGNRAAILAYGPTGSGKSYSMEGEKNNPGIVERALICIDKTLKADKERGWKGRVKGEALELYNSTEINKRESQWSSGIEEIRNVFMQAIKIRKTGGTECNTRSSRSHLILSLQIEAEREVDLQRERREGVLRIVDLAGSERLTQSKAEGERMKETVQINKSLTAIGDVVCAVAEKKPHIPYRNSKLTWALKDTIGEGARTAFIININPGSTEEETKSTLLFSQVLQRCTLGQIKKNVRAIYNV